MIHIAKGTQPADLKGEIYSKKSLRNKTIEKLRNIQKGKCCYCEIICAGETEHYFPQSTYPQFIDEWQNLFLICPHCNTNKGYKFQISGIKSTGKENFIDSYSKEKPSFVNPEQDYPEKMLDFDDKGKVSAKDSDNCCGETTRMQHTIESCKLNSDFLVKERLKVLQKLEENINAFILFGKPRQTADLKAYLKATLINSIKSKTDDFIAFRIYIVKHCLSTILKKI